MLNTIKDFITDICAIGFIVHLFVVVCCLVNIAFEFLEYAIFIDSINISRYAAMLVYSLIMGSLCYFITKYEVHS